MHGVRPWNSCGGTPRPPDVLRAPADVLAPAPTSSVSRSAAGSWPFRSRSSRSDRFRAGSELVPWPFLYEGRSRQAPLASGAGRPSPRNDPGAGQSVGGLSGGLEVEPFLREGCSDGQGGFRGALVPRRGIAAVGPTPRAEIIPRRGIAAVGPSVGPTRRADCRGAERPAGKPDDAGQPRESTFAPALRGETIWRLPGRSAWAAAAASDPSTRVSVRPCLRTR